MNLSERLNKFWTTVTIVLTTIGILLAINQLFYLKLFGFNPIKTSYLYFLLACFMPLSFIMFPFSKKMKQKHVRWFDVLFVLLTIIITIYFGVNGQRIISEGWEFQAPLIATIFSVIFWVLLLDALRRVAGLPIMIIATLFSLYPLIAGNIPIGFLQGQPFDFITTARNHVLSTNSIIGIPFDTVGSLLIGFMLFGVVLTKTGGGDFFFNLAQSIFGRYRGGAAKVSIISSAFFGMLSGSAVSNTITTGSMTIPSIKKAGYSPPYAGAIEACASTGGTITPPIMGSAAFIMASFLGVPYSEIAIAAAIPAVLYFFALLVQADGYAAKHQLVGLPKDKIPSFTKTMKDGWIYLFALVVLTYLLIFMRNEGQAPFYVSAIIFILVMLRKDTRLNWEKIRELIVNTGKVLTELTSLIAGIGFIVGALSITGVSFSFSRELISLAGDSTLFILIAGAITSFILGMGMTVSAVYIFLAVILAPALVQMGIDPIAAHLFVLYWATVSYITPPVALASFTAAGIANANPMRTGLYSVRLGIVTFIVPFIFVYEPAIIGRGEISDIIFVTISALVGVFFLASALEGYVMGAGIIESKLIRSILVVVSVLLIIPNLTITIIGLISGIVLFMVIKIMNRIRNKERIEMHEQKSV